MSPYLTTRHLRQPDGTFPHLGITDGDVSPVVVLSGSPARVQLMADRLDGAATRGSARGYQVFTGTYDGQEITVATSGVGAPSMSIAVEELAACGATTFLRAGSCAAIQEHLPVGGLAIARAAVSDEGTSQYYAPPSYPAVADHAVVCALLAAADGLDIEVTTGLTRTTDSFYEGERKADLIECWRALHVLAFEMETSALFTVALALGLRAGAILCAGSNLVTGDATYEGRSIDAYDQGQDRMLDVALTAAATLAGD